MRIALYEIPPLSIERHCGACSLTLYLACHIYGRSLRIATQGLVHLTVASLLNIVRVYRLRLLRQLSAANSR